MLRDGRRVSIVAATEGDCEMWVQSIRSLMVEWDHPATVRRSSTDLIKVASDSDDSVTPLEPLRRRTSDFSRQLLYLTSLANGPKDAVKEGGDTRLVTSPKRTTAPVMQSSAHSESSGSESETTGTGDAGFVRAAVASCGC